MFSTLRVSDAFAVDNDGIATQTIATGTTSGSAIPLGGAASAGATGRKNIYILIANSGTASSTLNLYLVTSTASGGSYVSISQTSPAALVSVSLASKYIMMLETRDEAFTDLGTGPLWAKPVIVVAGAALPMALLVLEFMEGYQPASNYDTTTATLITRTTFF